MLHGIARSKTNQPPLKQRLVGITAFEHEELNQLAPSNRFWPTEKWHPQFTGCKILENRTLFPTAAALSTPSLSKGFHEPPSRERDRLRLSNLPSDRVFASGGDLAFFEANLVVLANSWCWKHSEPCPCQGVLQICSRPPRKTEAWSSSRSAWSLRNDLGTYSLGLKLGCKAGTKQFEWELINVLSLPPLSIPSFPSKKPLTARWSFLVKVFCCWIVPSNHNAGSVSRTITASKLLFSSWECTLSLSSCTSSSKPKLRDVLHAVHIAQKAWSIAWCLKPLCLGFVILFCFRMILLIASARTRLAYAKTHGQTLASASQTLSEYSMMLYTQCKSCFRLELSSATVSATFRYAGFSLREHNSRTSPLCNFTMEVFDAAQLIKRTQLKSQKTSTNYSNASLPLPGSQLPGRTRAFSVARTPPPPPGVSVATPSAAEKKTGKPWVFPGKSTIFPGKTANKRWFSLVFQVLLVLSLRTLMHKTGCSAQPMLFVLHFTATGSWGPPTI